MLHAISRHPADAPHRIHETVQTFYCWRCRKRTYARRTYTIDFVDGRARRTYEITMFAGMPRCLTCGESLEVVASQDTDALESGCARRCMGANPHGANPCHCRTCFGAAHGKLHDEES